MKKALTYLIPVAIGFVLGFVAGRLQSASIENWYPRLIKPALTPPDAAFPIAWSIIYLLSGISAGRIWNGGGPARKSLLTLWGVQQFFNFTWSITFFYLQSPLAGLLNILLLDVLVVMYIVKAWPVDRPASAMFWPYLAWIAFATYLNLYIWIYN